MSYRVEYEGMPRQLRRRSGLGFGFQAMTAAFLLVFVLAVRGFWPQGLEVLRQWFLPEPVMEEFAERLAEGTSLTDSLEELCREVFALAEE